MTTATAYRIKPPELRGAALQLGACHEREACIEGSAGCVAGETRLYNPVTCNHTPIRELYEQQIAPIVQTLIGAMQADVPFCKGVADLYRVKMASGRECVVTGNHLFLTPEGWRFASSCLPASRLLVSSPCPLRSTEELALSVSQLDALHLSRIPLNSQEHYSVYPHLYDGQPHQEEGNDLTLAPLQAGAHVHTHVDLYKDDRAFLPGYTHQRQQSDLHARMYYSPLSDDTVRTLSLVQSKTSSQVETAFRAAVPFPRERYLPLPTAQSHLYADSTFYHALPSTVCPPGLERQQRDAWACSVAQQQVPCFLSSDTNQEFAETPHLSDACTPSMSTSNVLMPSSKLYYTASWDTVSSIKYERTDEYFDLHVPFAEHYLAEGIWHHNTGKTVGALYKIHVLLSRYPGSRALVARKTNTALSGSAMVTYRDNILRGRVDIHYFGGNRVEPAAFKYSNGSEMIVNGLDRPEKVQSAEFDWAYINEATECDLEDVEFVRMRLRPRTHSPDVPYRQLIMDCNPNAPEHWLNQRMNAGITARFISRHEDNPRYYDLATQDWTPEGREYIFGILEGLTGVRLARFRYGIWAAAEGAVYEDSWNRAKNVVKRFPIPIEWPRYMSLDFGYVNPFVCKWYAEDPDGRLYCYREIYHTKRLVEEHARHVKTLSRWGQPGGDPLPRVIYADHDAEGRATFQAHTGLITMPAHKAVAEGIQAMAARLRPAGDGKPRLMYFEDCLVERDRELAAAKKPVCTVEEFDSYIWKQGAGITSKDEPVKENDHGLDADRYLCAKDIRPSDVRYSTRVY